MLSFPHTRRPTRIGDPAVYKKLLKQIADSDPRLSKVDKEMDRFVGAKHSSDIRWKTMKRKYTLESSNNSKRTTVHLDPELIMRVQVRERAKEQNNSFFSSVVLKNPEEINKRGLNKKRSVSEREKFFSADKKSLLYLEQSSTAYIKLKTDENEEKSREYKNSWYNLVGGKRGGERIRRRERVRSRRVEHPVLDLYRETTGDVIESCKSRVEFKRPFGWFVSPYELDDF